MHILIAVGSKQGGTEGLARVLAETLTRAGHQVDARYAAAVDEIDDFDAVFVAGGLYARRWHRTARRFVERHVEELRRLPVWFFSSGSLIAAPEKPAIGPRPQIKRLMSKVGARGHVTLGPRDLNSAQIWGQGVACQLAKVRVVHRSDSVPSRAPVRRTLAGLCLFTGTTALAGALALSSAPRSALEGWPVSSFLVTVLTLLIVVGFANLLAGVLAVRRHPYLELAGLCAGMALTAGIAVQILLLHSTVWLQILFLCIALATMGAALWLSQMKRRA